MRGERRQVDSPAVNASPRLQAAAGKDFIRIRGAREHNLKNVNVDIPRNKLVVITGLSGSGKSSLAFDTIYAEGQRRYVESLSAYARQFLEMMEKPDVESIEGLTPTISIEQRTGAANPRSTVATTTEIYDYLRVLFARVGTPHCHVCGRVIESQSAEKIVDQILQLPEGTRLNILAPLVRGMKGEHRDIFAAARREGFARLRVDGKIVDAREMEALPKTFKHHIEAVVDRLVIKPGLRSRLTDSWNWRLKVGEGLVHCQRRRTGPGQGSGPETRSRQNNRKNSSSAKNTPARCTARAWKNFRRACSRSTAPTAPAPPAPGWAPRWKWTWTCSSPTRSCPSRRASSSRFGAWATSTPSGTGAPCAASAAPPAWRLITAGRADPQGRLQGAALRR